MRRFEEKEKLAARLEEHAATQSSGDRIIPTLFTLSEDHNGKDAPGWCLKMARRIRSAAKKAQKNYEVKQRERGKR